MRSLACCLQILVQRGLWLSYTECAFFKRLHGSRGFNLFQWGFVPFFLFQQLISKWRLELLVNAFGKLKFWNPLFGLIRFENLRTFSWEIRWLVSVQAAWYRIVVCVNWTVVLVEIDKVASKCRIRCVLLQSLSWLLGCAPCRWTVAAWYDLFWCIFATWPVWNSLGAKLSLLKLHLDFLWKARIQFLDHPLLLLD